MFYSYPLEFLKKPRKECLAVHGVGLMQLFNDILGELDY